VLEVRIVVGFLVLCSGLVGAACGSSDPSGLSHGELVRSTNAACTDLDRALKKIEEPENAQSYIEFVEGTHAAVKRTSDRLVALHPGKADTDAYTKLSGIYRQLERTLADLVDAARAEEPHKIEDLSSRVDRLVTSSHRAARDLGATGCAP
jgi:hypothetical protein